MIFRTHIDNFKTIHCDLNFIGQTFIFLLGSDFEIFKIIIEYNNKLLFYSL